MQTVGEVAEDFKAGRMSEDELVEELGTRAYEPEPDPALRPLADYAVIEPGTFAEVTQLAQIREIPNGAYFRIRRMVEARARAAESEASGTEAEFGTVDEVADAFEAGLITEDALVEILSGRHYEPATDPAIARSCDVGLPELGTFEEVTALFMSKQISDAVYLRILRNVKRGLA